MGAWDQISHPGRPRPTALLVVVTVAATAAMPLLLVQAIELGARSSGQRQSALPMVAVLGLVALVATLLVQRWMGAAWGVMGATAGLWLFVIATAYLAVEWEQLEAVGHRAPAVVAERRSALRARDHVCRLVRSSDGRPIEPALTGSDCYQLREGDVVMVVYDPAGEVPPMEADRFDRGEGMRAAATVLAWLYAAMTPLAAVRGHVLLKRAEVARPMQPPPGAVPAGIPYATGSPTGLSAACGLRCRPRWRLPVFPVLATIVAIGAAVLLVSTVPSYLAQQDEPPHRQYPERILAGAAGSAVALVPSGWVIVRLRRRRHKVRRGHRIPVTVYYGSDRGALARQTASRQAQVSATAAKVFMETMLQPTLVAVATDGAIWALVPEPGSYVSLTGRAPLPLSGSNPWILPLQALADDPRAPFAREALAPQQPLLGDRANGAVGGALARLAGHPGATPRDGDPPVPGELLLPATPVPTELGVPTFGPRVGLVLHRPLHAPVRAGIDRWSLRRLYFGSDPGECIGVYATHVALDAPEARGPHAAPPAIV